MGFFLLKYPWRHLMWTNFLLLATKFGHQVHHVIEEVREKVQVTSGDSFDELGHPFGFSESDLEALHASLQVWQDGHRQNCKWKIDTRLS